MDAMTPILFWMTVAVLADVGVGIVVLAKHRVGAVGDLGEDW